MNYKVIIKNIDPVRVAFLNYKGHYSKAGKHMPKVFRAISGKSNGAPFFSYYSTEKKSGICEMDLCFPTLTTPNSKSIMIKEFPGTKAACITHIGSYNNLPISYDVITNYMEENNLEYDLPWREVYIKGPGLIFKGNPKKYITEILFPLKEVSEF